VKCDTNQTKSFEASAISFEEIIIDEWNALFEMTSPQIMQLVTNVADEGMHDLLDKYRHYLNTEASLREFLHSNEMRDKWVDLFESWVRQLFKMEFSDAMQFVNVQTSIGEKLSRIGYPPHAVTKALRIIKTWALKHIFNQPWGEDEKVESVMYVTNLIGLSFEIRNHGYMTGVSHQSRLDETFRMMAIGNNVAMERERQRALLSEWEKSILAAFYVSGKPQLLRILKSEFGIWFTHKASLIFEQESRLNDVVACMHKIDEEILPVLETISLQDYPALRKQLDLVDQQLVKIRFIMGESFDAHMEFENAKDVLTNLLNRRFMHTVLSREINLQRRKDSIGFSLLLLDLDHFKRINDTLGHPSGDVCLQAIADRIKNILREYDLIGRIGGEEFGVLLFERTIEELQRTAGRLCFPINVSIQGHPEPLRLTVSAGATEIRPGDRIEDVTTRADEALIGAKNNGRERMVLWRHAKKAA